MNNLTAINKLNDEFKGWTIDYIEPSDKGDVGLKFHLSWGFHITAVIEIAFSCLEGAVFVNDKRIEELR